MAANNGEEEKASIAVKDDATQKVGSGSAGAAGKRRKRKNKKKSKAARERALLEKLHPRVEPEDAVKLMKTELGEEYDSQIRAHGFWDHQPVLPLTSTVDKTDNCPIDRIKTVSEIPEKPGPLPEAYEWHDVDVNDPEEMKNVYELLRDNYVEDDDNMFRFDYSEEFLRWAVQPPGYLKTWHITVRGKENKKLYGFISAIPALIRVYEKKIRMVEINFLCVHKKLRAKSLAPVLIREITRRVNRTDIWQAVFTAGRVLPSPVASCRYYHRSLNPAKLVAIKFSRLPPRRSMALMKRIYKLPEDPLTPGFRPFKKSDIGPVLRLLREYLAKFHVAPYFDEHEVAHWFLPREGVINSFVVEDPQTKEITDFGSFYSLPSTVIGHNKYKQLRAAYSFYNVTTKTPLKDFMNDLLIMARKLDYDVFNALNVMDNESILSDLKFGIGDGHLQYYLYNWKCSPTTPNNVGLVML